MDQCPNRLLGKDLRDVVVNLDHSNTLSLVVLIAMEKRGNLLCDTLTRLRVMAGNTDFGAIHQQRCQDRAHLSSRALWPNRCPVSGVHCLDFLGLHLSDSHIKEFATSVQLVDTVSLIHLE